MDGLELLKQDHDMVNTLFRQFEQGGNSQEFEMLFMRLYDSLVLHTIIEEQVFYPMLKSQPETASLIREAFNEHAQAKETLTKIGGLDNTSAEWGQKMTTLMREVTQHVQEEEGVLFPKVRQLMSEAQLQQLGQELQRAKDRGINSSVLNDLTQQAATAMPSNMTSTNRANMMTETDMPSVNNMQPVDPTL